MQLEVICSLRWKSNRDVELSEHAMFFSPFPKKQHATCCDVPCYLKAPYIAHLHHVAFTPQVTGTGNGLLTADLVFFSALSLFIFIRWTLISSGGAGETYFIPSCLFKWLLPEVYLLRTIFTVVHLLTKANSLFSVFVLVFTIYRSVITVSMVFVFVTVKWLHYSMHWLLLNPLAAVFSIGVIPVFNVTFVLVPDQGLRRSTPFF